MGVKPSSACFGNGMLGKIVKPADITGFVHLRTLSSRFPGVLFDGAGTVPVGVLMFVLFQTLGIDR
jgi:hypothetical protein